MIAVYMVAMMKNVDKNDEDDCIEIDPTIDLSHENIQVCVIIFLTLLCPHIDRLGAYSFWICLSGKTFTLAIAFE